MSNRMMFRLVAASALIAGCSSTGPGPGPLPEPRGKLLVYYSSRDFTDTASPAIVIRDVASGVDSTAIVRPNAVTYISDLRMLPNRQAMVGARYLGPMHSDVVEFSLAEGVVRSLYDPGAGQYASNPSLSPLGDRVVVAANEPHRLVEVGIADGDTVGWWRASGDERVYGPQRDPWGGGLLATISVGGTFEFDLVHISSPGVPPELVLPHTAGVFVSCRMSVAQDGRIAYQLHDGTLAIHLRAGVLRRDTLPAGFRGVCPVFSPDGEFLAYLDTDQDRIWLYRFRDGRLTPGPRASAIGTDDMLYDWWYD